MLFKKAMLPVLSILLVGVLVIVGSSKMVHATETPTNYQTLEWVFNNVNKNYTRDTDINLNEEAFARAKAKNKFAFTLQRTTLWIDQGLYMYSTDGTVNSGYFTNSTEANKMYHYNINGGITNIADSSKVQNVAFSSDIVGGMNAFFIDMCKFHDNASSYSALFTNTANNTWESTDLDMINYFLAFCASCYTNTEAWDVDGNGSIGENEVLEFSKVIVTIPDNSGNFLFKLYVTEACKSVLDSENINDCLFASASVHNIGSTAITALSVEMGK